MNTQQRPKAVVMVLGMHRSGTSCLTGSMQSGGLWLGQHSTHNPYNHKGNRENRDVFAFHEQILRDHAASWHTPPRAARWNAGQRAAARALLAEHRDAPIWGFKDPRTLLWVGEWLALIPDAALVGIYRHPLAVAQSLLARGAGIRDLDHALGLWRTYNRRMLRLHRIKAFPVLSFDWDEETFHRALDCVHSRLGLQPIPPGQRFFEEDLRHRYADQAPLPWRTRRIYRQLTALGNRLLEGVDDVQKAG